MKALERLAPGQIAAVYMVGGVALADFSPRLSNIDLVVVSDRPLDAAQTATLRQAERGLVRVRRAPGLWYTSWEAVAGGRTPSDSALDTPMTRQLLRDEALALTGPDWPVVAYDEAEFRTWCARELSALAAAPHGLMLMRRGVASLVLQAARLAQGAVTGRVLSKSEAGQTAISLVPSHFRRILTDAAGFRGGAHTSMYWGPFERKYDARELIRHLLDAVRG
jgi:hypothetical protein